MVEALAARARVDVSLLHIISQHSEATQDGKGWPAAAPDMLPARDASPRAGTSSMVAACGTAASGDTKTPRRILQAS